MSDTVKIKYVGDPIDAGVGMLDFRQPEVGETYQVRASNWDSFNQEGWELVKDKPAKPKKKPVTKKAAK